MPLPETDLLVYPDQCDAYGHLNQAAFLVLFERARWNMFADGPGIDVFQRAGVWPAVRRASVDYLAQVFPGDTLRFQQTLTHLGRTSFTLRQSARRIEDDVLAATAEFVFVCLGANGKPAPVPRIIAELLEETPEEGAGQRVTVNGVGLAVDVVGDGPAILFIHGYPLDRSIWKHQVEHLDGWRRIAPDLRGMGSSDAPDLGYSMTTYADDLAALLDSLGVDHVVLCGLSMGGYVAFEFLRRHRARVRGLILVDTRAENDSAEGRRSRDSAAQVAREDGTRAVAAAMLPKLFAGETEDAVGEPWRQVERMIVATPIPGIVGALAAMRDRPDSTALLESLDLPALIIVGEHDRITPLASSHRMASALAGSKLEVIPAAGHLSPVERPGEVTEAIRRFLEQVR
ncbi:MAG TPA: alpha/beta fold hydrolase [Gemmatimonadales bacterium]|nr:alpha/beta fold hydrolase [Gemmatimonadales bacterium]